MASMLLSLGSRPERLDYRDSDNLQKLKLVPSSQEILKIMLISNYGSKESIRSIGVIS